jgi:aminotransferase in exopolysaccharide biosynthesis
MKDFKKITDFIKGLFPGFEKIPLHAPIFNGNEKKYVIETIDSTYVSSVGSFVNRFEEMMCEITGAKHAIAIVNGTSALHLSMILAGIEDKDEVLSQSLTFIATCNAISYLNATPVFIDIDKDTLGMSPNSLLNFLEQYAEKKNDGFTYNKQTGKRIKACVPMHSFGFPCRIDEISKICKQYNIVLIEDAAESIGSYYQEVHTGLFGLMGTFSFNGNKTVTCGGGGAIITNDAEIARKAKHLSTQAKVSHPWSFIHDEIGFNYRMPNINAALACAQLEQLNLFVENKRMLAKQYSQFFDQNNLQYVKEINGAKANFWLNTLILESSEERDLFLEFTNSNGVMSRPVWDLMHTLPMFENCFKTDLSNSIWIADRLVNIPSSVRC